MLTPPKEPKVSLSKRRAGFAVRKGSRDISSGTFSTSALVLAQKD
jgi:hypothetical protein